MATGNAWICSLHIVIIILECDHLLSLYMSWDHGKIQLRSQRLSFLVTSASIFVILLVKSLRDWLSAFLFRHKYRTMQLLYFDLLVGRK